MGLLDGLVGSVLSNVLGGSGQAQAAQSNPMMNIAMQVLQQHGGLQGLMGVLNHGGMGQQSQSWVGAGPNQGVTGDMLKSVLGSGVLGQLGQQHGMDANQVSGGLAAMLPELINQVTPHGQVNDQSHDLMSQIMGAVLKR